MRRWSASSSPLLAGSKSCVASLPSALTDASPVSPPQITESFLALAPWFCSNKDGQGDGTGTIPDPVVEILEDYFVGPQDRVKEYRTQHAAALRFRCEQRTTSRLLRFSLTLPVKDGEGRSSHDALHLVRWGSHRVPFSNEQLASIKVPTLLLQGSADTIVSPLEAVKEWQERMTGGPFFRPLSAPSY